MGSAGPVVGVPVCRARLCCGMARSSSLIAVGYSAGNTPTKLSVPRAHPCMLPLSSSPWVVARVIRGAAEPPSPHVPSCNWGAIKSPGGAIHDDSRGGIGSHLPDTSVWELIGIALGNGVACAIGELLG